jgi:putative copper export protein
MHNLSNNDSFAFVYLALVHVFALYGLWRAGKRAQKLLGGRWLPFLVTFDLIMFTGLAVTAFLVKIDWLWR